MYVYFMNFLEYGQKPVVEGILEQFSVCYFKLVLVIVFRNVLVRLFRS